MFFFYSTFRVLNIKIWSYNIYITCLLHGVSSALSWYIYTYWYLVQSIFILWSCCVYLNKRYDYFFHRCPTLTNQRDVWKQGVESHDVLWWPLWKVFLNKRVGPRSVPAVTHRMLFVFIRAPEGITTSSRTTAGLSITACCHSQHRNQRTTSDTTTLLPDKYITSVLSPWTPFHTISPWPRIPSAEQPEFWFGLRFQTLQM